MSELKGTSAGADGVIKRHLSFPESPPSPTGILQAAYLLLGLLLFPFYWLAAALLGAPGMRFRRKCFAAGVRLLLAGHFADAYRCIVCPLDSVRHFEMEFFWGRIRSLRPSRILDVSSPRLLTLLALRADTDACADLVNPDAKDLARTRAMAQGLGVNDRCRFLEVLVDALPDDARNYPLVTCMSVLEHIVNDLDAVRVMWGCIAPGGRLLLSMPCAAQAMDEFTNVDEYGLLAHDSAGFVFWQRYYDESRLQEIFAITGSPVARELYAERVSGTYDADVRAKRSNYFFARWREPLATVLAYARRDNLATLPGMGVVALEFRKPVVE